MDVICEVHVNSLLLTLFSVTHFVNASKQEGHLQQYSMIKTLIQKLPPIPGRNKRQFKSSNMLP